eukprot:2711705-Amphidinium_carterae.1
MDVVDEPNAGPVEPIDALVVEDVVLDGVEEEEPADALVVAEDVPVVDVVVSASTSNWYTSSTCA